MIVFYASWNCFRKLLFALMAVFFIDYPMTQLASQLFCSGVMLAYLIRYMPFAQFINNFNKILNEMCIILIYAHLTVI